MEDRMTEAERMDALYDLSTAWRAAGEIFPYFEEKEMDWDAVYGEYLPRVFSVVTKKEFHLLMAEFLNRLGDGHTDYRFPRELVQEAGYLPFHLVYLDGGWHIREIPAGKEEFLLAKVTAVNGVKMPDFLSECFRYIYHIGDYANPGKLEEIMPFLLKKSENVLTTSNGMFRFDLLREAAKLVGITECVQNSGEGEEAGELKNDGNPNQRGGRSGDGTWMPKYRRISKGNTEIRIYEGNILYARMDDFLHPGAAGEIAEALSGMDSPDGVILDIRENIGGMTAYAARVAELFIAGEFSGCRKKTRQMKGIDVSSASQYIGMCAEQIEKCVADGLCTKEEVERCLRTGKNMYYYEYQDFFGAQGKAAMYDGPVVLLTSRGTISAAEDFTAMFKSNCRATLIGAPTLGTTGTPFLKRLRLGGAFRICSVGYRLLDGTEFIGKGILPDIYLEGDAKDTAYGRDVVLAKAFALCSNPK